MFDQNKLGKKYIPEGTKTGSPIPYQILASLNIKNTEIIFFFFFYYFAMKKIQKNFILYWS